MAHDPYWYRSHTPGSNSTPLEEHGHQRTENPSHHHRQSQIYTSLLSSRVHDPLEQQFHRLSIDQSIHIPYDPSKRDRSRGYEDREFHSARSPYGSGQSMERILSRSSGIGDTHDQQYPLTSQGRREPFLTRPLQRETISGRVPMHFRETSHDSIYNEHEHERRGLPQSQHSTNENLSSRPSSTTPLQRRDVPPSRDGPVPRGQRPEFIIIGLFVLRITRRLVDKLDSYTEKNADMIWIDSLLSQYSASDDLAELRGSSIDNFAKTWPVIINHFIKQPKFPLVFTQMNPVPRLQGTQRLSDRDIRDMVDFADAAAEWGSVVQLPKDEAQRIESLAAQRRLSSW
ncbi:unnamed protein product [Periconia digitata]|uniref:Uncharacterized protein n=1 Tax=Periconia digitata TaxID=1303443 RepID=A0A9W4UDK0_9PLEO|nr:unnamed protein product [Periconia digitata]